MFAYTIRDVNALNAELRQLRSERGELAEPVADMADQSTADGPQQATNREDAESCQHLRDWLLKRKEGAADCCGKIAVDREVIPFKDVADAGQSHFRTGR